jgi:hypothetical protein
MQTAGAKLTEGLTGAWGPLATVLPAFVLTRLAIFLAATWATDARVYYRYGLGAREASVGYVFRAHDVEYPQLAVLFSAGVTRLADALPPGAERLISARPGVPSDSGLARFQVALGLVLVAIDLGLLLLVARHGRDLQPNDRGAQTWRLGLYVAGTAALGPILYDRLDLVVGAVALVAVGARRPCLSYALLAAGAAFKVVPVLLVPLFITAAAARRGGRFPPALAREAGAAILIVAAWPVAAVLFGGGDRAFVYTKYHGDRGLELGSVYAAPVLTAPDASVGFAFGGHVVRGPTADAVAGAAPVAVLVALALSLAVAGRAILRAAGTDRVSVLAGGCVLVWLAFILTNKVGSPQYLLWVAPLVPLLPLRARAERAWGVAFVTAGVLATLTYPYLWHALLGAPLPDRAEAWVGPNALGFAILIARWGLAATLTGWLAAHLWRTGSVPCGRGVAVPQPAASGA